MIAGALAFIIETAFGLFTFALLLRFYLQWARAPHRNPASDFLHALTDFAVRPARRLIPGLWGIDFSTLTLAWLAQFLESWLTLAVRGWELGPQVGAVLAALALLALVKVVKLLVYIVMGAVLIQAILSWVAPQSPVMPLLSSMARPWTRVFQRFIPPVGNVDLSPLFVLVACQLILMVPLTVLEGMVLRLL
jgi:YggT family protein